jgi:uncharacterized protein (TIGR03437 family)
MSGYIFRLLYGFAVLGAIASAAIHSGKRFGPENKTLSVQATQTTVELIELASGLTHPLYVTHARDDSHRLFIVERAGRIRVMLPEATLPLATPFLDISTKVIQGGERGLLGLAFHPQYATNRRFFVNYSRMPDGATIISEFKVSTSDPNLAEAEERVVLAIAQQFAFHKGGMIEFGPDGLLYIGLGDGGPGNDPNNNAQNPEVLLGKMLRIDIDNTDGIATYSSPPDNPFSGSTPGRDEIYAMGLRNPFRWSFDRLTGQLYLGDVGEGSMEEIDIIESGGNYGWRVFEGTHCTFLGPAPCDPGLFTQPIYEYGHSNNRCSVIGGYVYRGSRSTFPSGSYLFGDFCTGEIFIYKDNSVSPLLDTDQLLVSFGEDESGELYVVGLGGSIFRIAASVETLSGAGYFGNPYAPDSIVAAFGRGFSTSTETPSGGQETQTTLAGVTVTVTDALGVDRLAPLLYAAPTQINYQIPPGTAIGNATIAVTNINRASFADTIDISYISPGLFTADMTGRGIAASVVLRKRADGTDIYEPLYRRDQNQIVPIPIDLGPETDRVLLILRGTGFRYRSSLSAVTVKVGEIDSPVIYAGVHGSSTLLDQANVLLPRNLAGRGRVDVVMTVDGQTSNTVQVVIR